MNVEVRVSFQRFCQGRYFRFLDPTLVIRPLDQGPVYIVIRNVFVILHNSVGFFVHKSVAVLKFHVLIEFIHHWHGVWDFEFFDVLITYVLYVLEKCPQSVFMRDYDDFLPVNGLPAYLIVPKRDHTIESTFERLDRRKGVFVHILIFFVESWMSIIIVR